MYEKLVRTFCFFDFGFEKEKLDDDLKFAGYELKSSQVISASIWIFILILLISILSSFLIPELLLLSFCAPLSFYLVQAYPSSKASLIKFRKASGIPNLLIQLCIILKQNPNLENALELVSKSREEAAKVVRKEFWRCMLGKQSGKQALNRIKEEWRKYFEEADYAIHLINLSLAQASKRRREELLDRAIEFVLDGLRRKVDRYAKSLHIPILVLFSFGTVLPLILLTLFPIMTFLGISLGYAEITLFLGLSIFFLWIYSNHLIGKRPPAFPVVSIKPGKMEFTFKGKRIELNPLFLFAIFIAISAPSIIFILSLAYPTFQTPFTNFIRSTSTIWFVIALSACICIYSYSTSWRKLEEVKRIMRLDDEAIDGFYQLSSRIYEGRSLEDSIGWVRQNMKGSEFAKLMESIENRIKKEGVELKKAIEEEGLKSKSDWVRIGLCLTSGLVEKGIRVLSDALSSYVESLRNVKKVKEEIMGKLSSTMQMMRITAIIFTPIICGMVVGLQQMIQVGLESALSQMRGYEAMIPFITVPSFSVDFLQLMVGIYAILLIYILIRFITFIEFGENELIFRDALAKATLAGTFIFLFVLFLSKMILVRI